jgi:hypothetical protein
MGRQMPIVHKHDDVARPQVHGMDWRHTNLIAAPQERGHTVAGDL